MRIAVLGATGQTGLEVVYQALADGYEVVAYVRRNGDLPSHENLTVRIGELDDVGSMAVAFQSADAVITCLGPASGPSAFFKKHTLLQDSVPTILQAMRASGSPRLVMLSALGVGASAAKTSTFARFLYATFVRTAYCDKVRAEKVIVAADLEAVLVYPAVLTNEQTGRPAKVTSLDELDHVAGLPKVSRADVAGTLLEGAATDRWIGKTVVVY